MERTLYEIELLEIRQTLIESLKEMKGSRSVCLQSYRRVSDGLLIINAKLIRHKKEKFFKHSQGRLEQ